jgi:putative SOS response-associated peptidase YedK
LKKRRWLVPANWIYEWPGAGKPPKQPYRMEMSNGSTFAIAGLWDAWKEETGRWIQSFAMVTTEANEQMAQIHSRIPVMLHERDCDRRLDRGETQRLPLDLLRPYEAEAMEMHEANPKVGNTGNNGPDMMTNPAPCWPRFRCKARSHDIPRHAGLAVFCRARAAPIQPCRRNAGKSGRRR